MPTINDNKVYKREGGNDCIYNCGEWWITPCDAIPSNGCYGYSVSSSAGRACVYDPSFTWAVDGSLVEGMKASTSLQCASDPPATPDGATISNQENVVGTVATYTCTENGQETKSICDAATLNWKPATIPSDLCMEPTTSTTTTTNNSRCSS